MPAKEITTIRLPATCRQTIKALAQGQGWTFTATVEFLLDLGLGIVRQQPKE